jgi:hypothetical protein
MVVMRSHRSRALDFIAGLATACTRALAGDVVPVRSDML